MEHDIGVHDENDGGRRSVEASTRSIANGAKRCTAVYVVAQVVLPHLLLPNKKQTAKLFIYYLFVNKN